MTKLSDLIDKKTLKQINESVLGDLPSKKLMKMKWNPVTESTPDIEPIEEGNNTQYSWGQINNALMSYGMSPAKILRFLSVLKSQTKNR